jgi:hypothetical protein
VDTQGAAALAEDGTGMLATGARGIGQVVRGGERPFTGLVIEREREVLGVVVAVVGNAASYSK